MTCRAPSSSTLCAGGGAYGQTLAYDSAGRMASWQNAPSPTSTQAMAYDGEGNRVALQVTGGTHTYYVGSLEEVSGSSVTKYISAGVSGLPTAERVGTAGTLTYLISDGLGSLDMALDGSGNVLAQQLFFPYGRPFYSSGTMPTAKGFTGQRTDGATSGLVYLNARYYDYVGRAFLSADTASDGLNRYAYAHWNPETLSDPSGNTTNCAPGVDLCNGKCVVCSGSPTPTPPTTPPLPPGCQATGDCGGGSPPGGTPPTTTTTTTTTTLDYGSQQAGPYGCTTQECVRRHALSALDNDAYGHFKTAGVMQFVAALTAILTKNAGTAILEGVLDLIDALNLIVASQAKQDMDSGGDPSHYSTVLRIVAVFNGLVGLVQEALGWIRTAGWIMQALINGAVFTVKTTVEGETAPLEAALTVLVGDGLSLFLNGMADNELGMGNAELANENDQANMDIGTWCARYGNGGCDGLPPS